MKSNSLSNFNSQNSIWLVTGCAGFIGSHLVEALLKANQTVIGLDNFATGHKENLQDIESRITPDQWSRFQFFEGDITNLEDCINVTKGVDIVLHQAALGSVPRSIENPSTTNNVNVGGFVNMLQAAHHNKVKRFVYASSSSVYGDSEDLPKVEIRTGSCLSPYAVSKSTNELYAKVFYRCYQLQTIGLRYFNVFGPRQDPNGPYAAVIPRWILGLIQGQKPIIFGDGKTSRDFTFISNVIHANFLAATTQNKDVYGKVFNAAAGGRTSLRELFDSMRALFQNKLEGFDVTDPTYEDFRAGDIRHSCADIRSIESALSFSPIDSIDAGLEKTISWYIERYNRQMCVKG